MSELIDTLTSYVPSLIAHRVAAEPNPIAEPRAESLPGAVLFADISGFTALTERLAQQGPAGAEELAQLLKAYFGKLTVLIAAHGGDIVKFAGDALLALWPARDEDLPVVTLRAAQCGLVVQDMLNDYHATDDVRLGLKVGIGAGEVLTMHVGGMYERWEFLVAGTPLTQMSAAEKQAQPGDVVLSAEAWGLVRNMGVGNALPEGGVRLEALLEELPLHPLVPVSLRPDTEAALQSYIPAAVRARLDAGQTEWLAEFRHVTVLFVNIIGLDYAASDALAQAHRAMYAMQNALYHYEGSVNQFLVDDKGPVLLAAFGLPPMAHEDDTVRGVMAALEVQGALCQLGLRSTVGIGTGQVFCGPVGSDVRCEYAIHGNVVNLAARLMQVGRSEEPDLIGVKRREISTARASSSGTIRDHVPHSRAASDNVLCDAATYQAAKMHLQFEPLPPIAVKGKTEPIQVYRPKGHQAQTHGGVLPMIGRRAERVDLAEHLKAVQKGTGGLVVVEGEAGIGKSQLVTDLLKRAKALGVTGLIGVGSAIEKTTSYYAWRSVFSQLFNLDEVTDDLAARRTHVLAQLQNDPRLIDLAPLLNDILPLDFPENELTRQMTGEVRANNSHELLVGLLQKTARAVPLLLILEDAHWLDSASWSLTRWVSQEAQPVLLVIVTRPLADPLPTEYSQLLRAPNTNRLTLDVLPPEDTAALVCQRLGIAVLPEPIAALIREKAQGNPFFSEQLAYALRDAGFILITDGVCRISPDAGDPSASFGQALSTLNLPDTLQGLIISRIDRLTPSQQLTLKVASAIGRVFAYRVLRDIHPIEADRQRLPAYLDTLDQLDITSLDTPPPDLAYTFKHIITQEVAYNLMVFSQRQQLHCAIAEWYEQNYTDDLASLYPLLAHHWSKAVGDLRTEPVFVSKAISYLEKAGESAMRSYANRGAVDFFSKALALHAHLESHRDQLRRARWERQLGEAHFGLGHLAESRKHFQRALALLKQPVPTTRLGALASLLWQILLQILRPLRPDRFLGCSQAKRAILLEATCAYGGLGQIYYFAYETGLLLNASLRMLNLTEAAGLSPDLALAYTSPELAQAYTNMCITTGTIPFHALAEVYGRRARETAESMGHPPTLGWMLEVTSLYRIGLGQWEEAQEGLNRAVEIFHRLGARGRWEESLGLLGYVFYHQGDFAASQKLLNDCYASARRRGDGPAQAWALCGQVENGLRLGQEGHADKAVALSEQATEALLAENLDRADEIRAYGLLAVAYLRRNESLLARATARTAEQRIAQLSPTAIYSLEGYAGVTEVYLMLWENNSAQQISKRSALQKSARHACKALHKFARVFPIGRPRAWLWDGLYYWLSGSPPKAYKAWGKSLAAAERLAMSYEQGLAYYEIGRHLEAQDPGRREHLNSACRIFKELGAAYNLERAQAAIETL